MRHWRVYMAAETSDGWGVKSILMDEKGNTDAPVRVHVPGGMSKTEAEEQAAEMQRTYTVARDNLMRVES